MEAGGAAPKRRRGSRGDGADSISALPDAVLGEIVSLLPTNDGARTQILSSRWRHIWRSAPLNLDWRCLGHRHGDLAGVASRIISSHQGPGRRFCFNAYSIAPPSYPNGDPGNTKSAVVDAWLRSPALDNLQELDLSLENTAHPLSPSSFRFSATLHVVSLRNCNLSDRTVQGLHFPKLQQLTLQHVSISECSLNHMITECPALHCLMIYASFGFRCVRINSLSITSIGVVAKCFAETNEPQFEELIIENAPFLQRLLRLDESDLDQSYQSTELNLHVSVLSAPKLETLCCVWDKNYLSTKLSFGSTIIQGLHIDSLTVVVRTVKTLAVALNHLSLDFVINLMRCFPCLEKLYIQVAQPSRTSEKNLWGQKYRDLAKCLDIRLKTIILNSYRGSTSEVNFFTFFVLNAKVLESMILLVSGKGANNEEFIAKQRRKLQLENRASRGAQFHFTTRIDASYLADLRP